MLTFKRSTVTYVLYKAVLSSTQERYRHYAPPKHCLHGITSKKTWIIKNAARTSKSHNHKTVSKQTQALHMVKLITSKYLTIIKAL